MGFGTVTIKDRDYTYCWFRVYKPRTPEELANPDVPRKRKATTLNIEPSQCLRMMRSAGGKAALAKLLREASETLVPDSMQHWSAQLRKYALTELQMH